MKSFDRAALTFRDYNFNRVAHHLKYKAWYKAWDQIRNQVHAQVYDQMQYQVSETIWYKHKRVQGLSRWRG